MNVCSFNGLQPLQCQTEPIKTKLDLRWADVVIYETTHIGRQQRKECSREVTVSKLKPSIERN